RAPDGTMTTFDVPGSVLTYVWALNDAGTTAGPWADSSGVYHGFLRDSAGTVTSFDGSAGATQTFAESINRNGYIAGRYRDANGVTHGLIRTPRGRIISIDVPGAAQTRG